MQRTRALLTLLTTLALMGCGGGGGGGNKEANPNPGTTDGGTTAPCTEVTFYADTDADGHGDPANVTTGCSAPAGYVSNSDDCDDSDGEVYPGAAEVLCDGIVQSCGGSDGDVAVAGGDDLQAALDGAPADAIVCVGDGAYTGPFTITTSVHLIGSDGATLQGTTGSVVTIQAAGTTLENLAITGGAADDGGGVHVDADRVSLIGCDIFDNVADVRGGGVYGNAVEALRIEGCDITDNEADYGGGIALVADADDARVLDNTVEGNVARQDGGGLWGNQISDLTVTGNTFEGNASASSSGEYGPGGTEGYGGGVILLSARDITLDTNVFERNDAFYGGGLDLYQSERVAMSGNRFAFNSAYGGGGSAMMYSVGITSIGDVYEGNTASWVGAGLACQQCIDLTLQDGSVTGNIGAGSGAGVYLEGFNRVTLDGLLVEDNASADFGGGLMANATISYYLGDFDYRSTALTELTVRNTTFRANSADGAGGGAYVYAGTDDTFSGNTFDANEAQDGGGAVVFLTDNFRGEDNTYASNAAVGGGGGLAISNSDPTLVRDSFHNNEAGFGGGIFCEYGDYDGTDVQFSNNAPDDVYACN